MNSYLRSLRSLWGKHWKLKGFAVSNPSKEANYLNAPRGKQVRVPAEDAVAAFFD